MEAARILIIRCVHGGLVYCCLFVGSTLRPLALQTCRHRCLDRGEHVLRREIFLSIVAWLLISTPCWANPFDNFGLGSRSAAMGGAVTAAADDFSASLYNPAGLIDAGRMQVSIGYFFAKPLLETFWADAWRDISEDSISGVVCGIVFPPLKIGGVKFVGGMGLHVPDKRVARSLMLPYEQPRFEMYGARNQRMVVYSPNAFELTPWLSVGAGVQMFIDTTGGPKFKLIQEIPDNEGAYSEGTISSTQKPRFFPFAGILVKPCTTVRVGFCFREKQEITLDIPMVVTIDPLFGGLVPQSTIDLSTPAPLFFSPRQYAVGISWRPVERLLVAADLTYMQWSAFINPGPDGYTLYYGGLEILLRQNPNFHLPQGGFHDIWVPAIGIEYSALRSHYLDLAVRAGYRYRSSPVPEQKGRAAFLDSNTHIVSLGLGMTFRNLVRRCMTEPFSVDMHVQYFRLEQRDYVRDLLVAVSDRFGDLRFRGMVLSGGITTTFRF